MVDLDSSFVDCFVYSAAESKYLESKDDIFEQLRSNEDLIRSLVGDEEYKGQLEHIVHRSLEGKKTEPRKGILTREEISRLAQEIRDQKNTYDLLYNENELDSYISARKGPKNFLESIK